MEVNIRWSHPSSTFLVGPSMSGKTQILDKILNSKDGLFKSESGKTIKNIVLCYLSWQETYDQWEDRGLISRKFIGIPAIDELESILLDHSTNGGRLDLLNLHKVILVLL